MKIRTLERGGVASLVQRLFLGWAQGKNGLVTPVDAQISRRRRHDSEPEVTVARVSRETGMRERRVCFWNWARPLGEAQEECWERKYELQASPLCTFLFPKCLETVLRNALLKLNQLLSVCAHGSPGSPQITGAPPRPVRALENGVSSMQHPHPARAASLCRRNSLYKEQ